LAEAVARCPPYGNGSPMHNDWSTREPLWITLTPPSAAPGMF
jgi:hypothetical protein